jgi:polysaccharide deacetylase family protein (PEP-CTERM system associated)
MMNIISVDCEEAFCAYNMQRVVPREEWETIPTRIEATTRRLLDLFDDAHCEATFFVLGWVAERLPHLVQEIDRRGHEIATHGYSHTLLTAQTPRTFEDDLRKALAVTQCLVRQPIRGYRAPSFTVTPKTTWAYAVMERCGIVYDSSVFPISSHPEYGFPEAPLSVHRVSPGLTEVPISCVKICGMHFPSTGGAYFRMFPYFMTRMLFTLCMKQERPVVFYLHPWEIDPEQPRYALPLLRRWRHYHNIGKTELRLRRMLSEFSFTSMRKALSL